MDVAQRAEGGLNARQSDIPRGSRLALTPEPLQTRVRWHGRSVLLRPNCHICHAKTSLGLGPRSRVGTAGLAALPSHEKRRRRGSTAVVCAGGPSGGLQKVKRVRSGEVDTLGKKMLVGTAFAYVGLVLFIPFVNVFVQAFGNGVGPFLEHLTDEDFLHAAKLTMLLALVAVPVNTVFGIVAAMQLTRSEFWGKTFVMSMLDLPFSISPVVTGLMLVLLYGREGWFAPVIRATGFNIVFAFPGMALATLFVTLPFVVRELIPILEAMDMAEEEAARTLGASDWEVFWNVTLPNIRWGLLYGVILTNARAMGEFGAVSVISGNIIGKTQTLTLYVESAYKEYNTEAAFSASVLLSFLALGTLFIKDFLERKTSE